MNFFNALAERLKFDPLVADNWYTVSVDDACKLKVKTAKKAGGEEDISIFDFRF